MLGNFCISSFRSVKLVPSSNDAYLATSSSSKFWHCGTCKKFIYSNSLIIWFISFWYFYILLSFASYSPSICLIISFELLFKSNFLAPKDLATLSPISITLYYASLLVAGNWTCTPHFKMSPFGKVMTTLTSPIFFTNVPSVWIVHKVDVSCILSSSDKVNSTIE